MINFYCENSHMWLTGLHRRLISSTNKQKVPAMTLNVQTTLKRLNVCSSVPAYQTKENIWIRGRTFTRIHHHKFTCSRLNPPGYIVTWITRNIKPSVLGTIYIMSILHIFHSCQASVSRRAQPISCGNPQWNLPCHTIPTTRVNGIWNSGEID